MARTIAQIQGEMIVELRREFTNLSTSSVATWRLITYVVAVAIFTFEVVMDRFKVEMEERTRQITPATERWYAEMARRFQNGYSLAFDNATANYYYPTDEPASRIAKVVAVADRNAQLSIKVAKLNTEGLVKPFDADELQNFTDYIETIHVVGTTYSIISTTPDALRYNLEVFYDPIQSRTIMEKRVKEALERFKSSIGFNGTLYGQRLLDAVLHCDGVATVSALAMDRKGATDDDFSPVGAWCELHAGYFEYDKNSSLKLTSTSNAQN